MNILIGADPETFCKAPDGQLVSAYGMIPGDKKNPFRVEQGAVQVDGMALEFNIDPASSETEFVTSIESVMAQLADMLPEGHTLEPTPVAHFGKAYIESQPMEAKELGCDPDYNAYTMEENPTPNEDAPFRTGAGHVHIGWTDKADMDSPLHASQCSMVAKQLDLYLGVASVLFDSDNLRRDLYGKAGAYRPKTYGAEYRVLSNAWLKSKELTSWVYRTAILAVERLMANNLDFEKYGDVEQVINNSDVGRAREIVADLGLEVPNV